ncbi:MAG: ATPase domain-containing protein, partial [Candidatus Aenigmatarchaeota archaeon]
DVYLLTGGTGTGKTLFCCQFLWEGLQAGEKCIFFSLEELPDDILSDAKIFGWDFRKYINEGKFMIEYSDPFEMVDITSAIKEKIKRFGAKRVVIDSTSVLGMVFKTEHELRKKLYELIKAFKDTNVVVLMTSEVLEESKALSRYGVEEFIADGIIVLNYFGMGEVDTRSLIIRKMRRTNHKSGTVILEIQKDGLLVKEEKI